MPQTNENATNTLILEMGVVDTIRFLNQFTNGLDNYMEERRKMVDLMSLYDVFSGIDEMEQK